MPWNGSSTTFTGNRGAFTSQQSQSMLSADPLAERALRWSRARRSGTPANVFQQYFICCALCCALS